jgi:hypothetical protein
MYRHIGQAIAASAVIGALSHGAHAAPARPCLLERYTPVAIAPANWSSTIDYNTTDEFRGALLFVPAAAGLTREWLELSLQRELAADAPNSDAACNPPEAKQIRVDVRSAGNGYWVQLTEPDERRGERLRQWAERVVQKNVDRAHDRSAARSQRH